MNKLKGIFHISIKIDLHLFVNFGGLEREGFFQLNTVECTMERRFYVSQKKPLINISQTGLKLRKQLKSDKVDHDLDLVDIRYCFNQSKLVTQILTENDLQTWPEYYQRDEIRAFVKINSDSAINVQFSNGSFWMALEYESTAKNKSRYASLFQNYYAYEEVTAVIYVCQSKSILNKLMKEEKDFIGDNRRKFFYKTLEDLKQDRTMTFTNGLSEKLILADKSEK